MKISEIILVGFMLLLLLFMGGFLIYGCRLKLKDTQRRRAIEKSANKDGILLKNIVTQWYISFKFMLFKRDVNFKTDVFYIKNTSNNDFISFDNGERIRFTMEGKCHQPIEEFGYVMCRVYKSKLYLKINDFSSIIGLFDFKTQLPMQDLSSSSSKWSFSKRS